jgi:phytoene dehydrogenase-like protein
MVDVIIIGAGISGLTAANYLQQAGCSCILLEATDRVGGRVKTTEKDGFLLDHGFQVFSTAYPEAQALLNYEALDLKAFKPGAELLLKGGKKARIGDPLRDLSSLIPTLLAPVGSLTSKLKILKLKRKLAKLSISEIFESPAKPTIRVLKEEYGFDDDLIKRFFIPFYSGIFLEKELTTGRRMFDFVFKMFAEGEVTVPAKGMQMIPQQLAANLAADTVKVNQKVVEVENGKVTTAAGTSYEGKVVLIATEATALVSQYDKKANPEFVSTMHLHFTTPGQSPISHKNIALNTLPDRLVNNITVVSNIAPSYAPSNQHLISLSIVGTTEDSEEELVKKVRSELQQWFGSSVQDWTFLDCRLVRYALPRQSQVSYELSEDKIRLNDQLFVCGDYLLNGSINAAMRSGRIAAEAIQQAIS